MKFLKSRRNVIWLVVFSLVVLSPVCYLMLLMPPWMGL